MLLDSKIVSQRVIDLPPISNWLDTEDVMCVQQREWALNRSRGEIEYRLSTDYDRTERGDVVTWQSLDLCGTIRTRVRFDGTGHDTRLLYTSHRTQRSLYVDLGVLFALMMFFGVFSDEANWLSYLAELGPVTLEISPIGPLGTLFVSAVMLGVLSYTYSGPRPRFSTEGLDRQYATYSLFYVVWSTMLVAFVGLFLGSLVGFPHLGVGVFGFMWLATLGATGTVPAVVDGSVLESFTAGEPLFERVHSHLTVAILALLPALLTFLTISVASAVAPMEPSTTNDPIGPVVLNVLAPIVVGLVYCYWCLAVLQRLRSHRLEPYESRFWRALLFVGFSFVNAIVVLITMAFFGLLATPLLLALPSVEVPFNPTNGMLLGLVVLSLFSLATVGGTLQHRCERSDTVWNAVATPLRYGTYAILYVLFGLLSFVITTLIGAVAFGNTSLWTPSAEAEQDRVETYEAVTHLSGSLPIPDAVTFVGITIAVIFPVTILAVSWVIHVNGRLRDAILVWSSDEYLDTDDRPVPVSVAVIIVDTELPALAKPSLFGPPKILVGRRARDELSSDALDALLAHEAYHLQNQDHVIGLLAGASSFVFGGQNVLLSFYDIAESERAADRYAARKVSADALESALKTCKRLEADSEINQSVAGPAFVGSIEASVSGDRLIECWRDGRMKAVLSLARVRTLLLAPHALLFGGVVYDQAHLDYDDRTALLNLRREVLEYLVIQTTEHKVWLPRERTITSPVHRSELYEHLRERGATDEQIETTIAELIEDGRLVEIGSEYLLRRVDR